MLQLVVAVEVVLAVAVLLLLVAAWSGLLLSYAACFRARWSASHSADAMTGSGWEEERKGGRRE